MFTAMAETTCRPLCPVVSPRPKASRPPALDSGFESIVVVLLHRGPSVCARGAEERDSPQHLVSTSWSPLTPHASPEGPVAAQRAANVGGGSATEVRAHGMEEQGTCSQLSKQPGLGVVESVHGPVCVQLTAGSLAGVTALGLSGSDSRARGLLAVGQALPGCGGGVGSGVQPFPRCHNLCFLDFIFVSL